MSGDAILDKSGRGLPLWLNFLILSAMTPVALCALYLVLRFIKNPTAGTRRVKCHKTCYSSHSQVRSKQHTVAMTAVR